MNLRGKELSLSTDVLKVVLLSGLQKLLPAKEALSILRPKLWWYIDNQNEVSILRILIDMVIISNSTYHHWKLFVFWSFTG